MKIIKTIPLVARGPSLVESCHAKWQHWIAVQWVGTSYYYYYYYCALGSKDPEG